MAKNAYEIRLELLQLASTILTNKAAWQEDQDKVKAPTSEEIIAEAEKLNNFVSDAGGKKEK